MKAKKELIITYLKNLRDAIINAFETLEPNFKFQRTTWDHATGGGGEISLIRGDTFEKAAVNWSGVFGEKYPLNDAMGPFFATGISLITHMKNPHAPTVHMNLRYIETESEYWLGGGYDQTPMLENPYVEDIDHFHNVAKNALDIFDVNLYPLFSKNAKEYFYLPHRKKERGIGGIFFDHYNTGDEEQDFALWKNLGDTFLDAIMPIYKRRIQTPYTNEERLKQLQLRGHYAEFNLLYDRGTRFGIQSGGNPEAIFCSLPPTVNW